MKWIGVIAALLIAALLGGVLHQRGVMQAAIWQRQVSPGRLSAAHVFLENNCGMCHTPVKGVEPESCIVCHANNAALLQLQPTAFHAEIGTCSICHVEHQGTNRRPTKMNHLALARFGLRELNEDTQDSERRRLRGQILGWLMRYRAGEVPEAGQRRVAPEEMMLDCARCHSNQDKHMKLFGQDCAECHTTAQWTVAEFQHPSPRSTSCAQCHQPPPSHYMMHFEMVDKSVARKANVPGNPCCADVQVNQCYRCHQTNSWNDIKGAGWYKHH